MRVSCYHSGQNIAPTSTTTVTTTAATTPETDTDANSTVKNNQIFVNKKDDGTLCKNFGRLNSSFPVIHKVGNVGILC